jgi:hypothetical protein
MKRWGLAILVAGLLAACDSTGPVFPVDDAPYDWVKAPQTIDQTSDIAPVIAEPVVSFRLDRGDRKSALTAAQDWRVGQTYLFGFDVRLDRNSLGRETVELSRLLRKGTPATEIVSVQLDARRGVTVMGRACIAPSDLGDWHRVEMRIKLSNQDTGYLEVFCDRKPIWAKTEIRTTFSPDCRIREGCNAAIPKPVRYNWQIGLMSKKRVSRRVHVQMQKLHYRVLFYKPNRVGTL